MMWVDVRIEIMPLLTKLMLAPAHDEVKGSLAVERNSCPLLILNHPACFLNSHELSYLLASVGTSSIGLGGVEDNPFPWEEV